MESLQFSIHKFSFQKTVVIAGGTNDVLLDDTTILYLPFLLLLAHVITHLDGQFHKILIFKGIPLPGNARSQELAGILKAQHMIDMFKLGAEWSDENPKEDIAELKKTIKALKERLQFEMENKHKHFDNYLDR